MFALNLPQKWKKSTAKQLTSSNNLVETKRIELSTLRMRTVRSTTRAGFSLVQITKNSLEDVETGPFS